MRVLLVEDDLPLGTALARALKQAAFEVVWVRRLVEAREQSRSAPAAVVLDINLVDGEGFTLLEELRRAGNAVPVIVMTAREALQDRLRGLDGGADDYLVKPFAVAELIARLRAVVRRSAGFAAPDWRFGSLVIHTARREVAVDGEPVALTPTEYRLLVELARNVGRVVTRAALVDRCWSAGGEISETALDYHVHGLRRKVGAARIRTVRGHGYALEPA